MDTVIEASGAGLSVSERYQQGIADVVNLIAVNPEGEVLLVKKRDVWILPGGKIEDGESDLACLRRELGEELPGFSWDEAMMQYWRTFTGITPHSEREIVARTYLVYGAWTGPDEPVGAEITDSCWASDLVSIVFDTSSVTSSILDALARERILR